MRKLSSLRADVALFRSQVLPLLVVALMAIILASFTGLYWAYLGRVDLVAAQRRSCHDDIRDRRSDVLVRATQAWATQQIADDPKQPPRTRKARGIEAAQDRQSVQDRLTRVDDDAISTIIGAAKNDNIWRLIKNLDSGRRLDCAVEHPAARLLP